MDGMDPGDADYEDSYWDYVDTIIAIRKRKQEERDARICEKICIMIKTERD